MQALGALRTYARKLYPEGSMSRKPKAINRRRNTAPVWWWVLLASVLLHVGLVGVVEGLYPGFSKESAEQSKTVTMRIELPDPELDALDKEPDVDGQIVDIAPTENPERPEESDYLAEHDQVAPEETRTEQYRINPEILHHEYSTDDKLELEDLANVDAVEPSTGATVGNDRFDPDEHGAIAALPDSFRVTNKDGLQRPVPTSNASAAYAGAPNNDLLDLPAARRLALNTQKIQFAGYLNRIRRLVNFYWNQNIKNMPMSVRAQLRRPAYHTIVFAVLHDSGALESIEVTKTSGSSHMDRAVEKAFQIAGPFPAPPADLIAKDGRVYLPDFEFTVNLTGPTGAHRALDARAGVQFPGILKDMP